MSNLYVTAGELQRRRSEFFNASFDEMVEKIITLEAKLDEAESDRDELKDMVAELEGKQ